MVPLETFKDNDEVGLCFKDVHIAHVKDNEDFKRTWYDVIDADEGNYTFYYEASTNVHPVYFTVETYSYEIVASRCTHHYSKNRHMGLVEAPIADLNISYGNG